MTTNENHVTQLEGIGFGSLRSALMVERADAALIDKIVRFADRAKERGCTFRVFQANGRNGYYSRLRLMLITGKKPNRYTDSRGWEGSMDEVVVGSLGITKAQLAEIDEAVDTLSKALAD